MSSTLYDILEATWRDGAQLASPEYLKGADGQELGVMRVGAAHKALQDHLLDLIGPNEPVDYWSQDPNRSTRPEARNQVRDEMREKVKAWAEE